MRPEVYERIVEEPFNVPDLADVWSKILELHREMGFQIPLTDKDKGTILSDNEMIAEFQWIYGQYKKYIGTKRTGLLSCKYNLDEMLLNIKDLMEKSSETPVDRPTIIYQSMRNQWLIDTWNHIAWLKEQITESEESDD